MYNMAIRLVWILYKPDKVSNGNLIHTIDTVGNKAIMEYTNSANVSKTWQIDNKDIFTSSTVLEFDSRSSTDDAEQSVLISDGR